MADKNNSSKPDDPTAPVVIVPFAPRLHEPQQTAPAVAPAAPVVAAASASLRATAAAFAAPSITAVPSSRAINVSTEPNSVRAVVGGPLCESGLPFGHSVLCGDRTGAITLRNVVSGLTRKHIATSFHGHSSGAGAAAGGFSSNGGGLLPATCGEMVSVTVAEVVIAPDDGSPLLWIGCADGTVQVYFLGGHQRQQQHQSSSNKSPSSRARSPVAGASRGGAAAAATAAGPQSPLGDDIARMMMQQQQQHGGGGGASGAFSPGPHQTTTPVRSGKRTTTPHRRTPLGGGMATTTTSALALSPTASRHAQHQHHSASSSPLSPGNNRFGNHSTTAARGTGTAAAVAAATAAGGASSITEDGSVLIFAEKRHSGAVQALVSAPSIGSVFTGGADWLIVRWRAHHPLGVVAPVGRHSRSIRSLTFAPGNPCILISGADDGVIKLWSSRQKRAVELTGHRGSVMYAAPWYDTLALFGDVINSAVVAAAGSAASASVAGGIQAATIASLQQQQQQFQQNQQTQKATGVISCGEDGTMRLWTVDATVANTVVRVSSHPVVRCQVFSDNLVAAFSKDGAASIYYVTDFPNAAQCIYRYDNVGQVHRAIKKSPSSSPSTGGVNGSNARGKLSNYLHDVKVLAHIDGFLLWSLTTQGARLSMLPLRHFESTTKRQLHTITEKKQLLEGLLVETLDDADSCASGGNLLFQRLLDGSLDIASLSAAAGAGGAAGMSSSAHATLLQLAKLQAESAQHQQQTSNSIAAAVLGGGGGAGNNNNSAWQFDPTEPDLDLDPGQLSLVETSISSLRALSRSVNTALMEMSRLLEEFYSKKMELHAASFVKVMEKTKTTSLEYLKRELDALSVREKEISKAEKEMMAAEADSKSGSAAAVASSAASKVKVNPRKQIADMLSEMLIGKRVPIQTRSSAVATLTSSNEKVQVPATAKATLGDEEKLLIDGIQRTVTGEGAASYLYSYIAAKQYLASDQAQAALVLLKSKKDDVELQREKMQQDEKARAEKEKERGAQRQAAKEKAELLEKEEAAKKRSEQQHGDASSVKTKLLQQQQQEMSDIKSQLERAVADVAELRKKNYEWEEKCTKAMERNEELLAKIPKEPPKMAPLLPEDRVNVETRHTGAFAPSADCNAAATGPAFPSIAALSLVLSCDKKFMRNRKDGSGSGTGAAAAGSGTTTTTTANPGGTVAPAKKKKKDGDPNKSDEDDVAAKTDHQSDKVIVTLPGVGSWSGAERRTIATQTKLKTAATASAQVNTVDVSCLSEDEQRRLREQTGDELVVKSPSRDNNTSAARLRTSGGVSYQLRKNNNNGDDGGVVIIPVTLPAGWNEEDFALIRESEEFLGIASDVPSSPMLLSSSSKSGGKNRHHQQHHHSSSTAVGSEDHVSAIGAASVMKNDDARLGEISDTVGAAMRQLRQLESLRDGTTSSMAALRDAAVASGMSLGDPRVQGEMQRLQMEEELIAAEMHRLHHLLVAPASPIVPSSFNDPREEDGEQQRYNHHHHHSHSGQQQQQQRQQQQRFAYSSPEALVLLNGQKRDELAGAGFRSLMQEFNLLMRQEKHRINSGSPTRGARLE